MGLDPLFPLMEDRVDGEVGFEIFEGFFDGDELDVVLPKDGGVTFDKIGAQQIAVFAAADLAQLASVEGKGEAGRGRLDLDVNQAPADRSLGASGSQLHQQLLAGDLHCCGEFVEASPQPFQLPPAHRPFLEDPVGALGEHIELAVLGQQFHCTPLRACCQGLSRGCFSSRVRRPFGVPTR